MSTVTGTHTEKKDQKHHTEKKDEKHTEKNIEKYGVEPESLTFGGTTALCVIFQQISNDWTYVGAGSASITGTTSINITYNPSFSSTTPAPNTYYNVMYSTDGVNVQKKLCNSTDIKRHLDIHDLGGITIGIWDLFLHCILCKPFINEFHSDVGPFKLSNCYGIRNYYL